MRGVKDASHLYEVERRAYHAERPGFRITELQMSPAQTVPWHCHSNIQDTFYIIEGQLRLFLREPKEEVLLGPGDTYSVAPKRPHLVTNADNRSTTFLVLQGIGEYDYVPLVADAHWDELKVRRSSRSVRLRECSVARFPIEYV